MITENHTGSVIRFPGAAPPSTRGHFHNFFAHRILCHEETRTLLCKLFSATEQAAGKFASSVSPALYSPTRGELHRQLNLFNLDIHAFAYFSTPPKQQIMTSSTPSTDSELSRCEKFRDEAFSRCVCCLQTNCLSRVRHLVMPN